jgi:soluble lytic murein transglycosylase-like protein
MSEVNGISNIEQKSAYSLRTGKSTSTGNKDFSSYLEETKSLDDIFNEAAKKYNVPVDLLKAIGKAESDFDIDAVSRCGAQGVMQLMPGTAAELGVKDSFDPEQNIMGGTKYISDLLKRFDGDTSLALAAYNSGANNVKKYGGIFYSKFSCCSGH